MFEEAIPSALGAAIYPPALLFVAFLLFAVVVSLRPPRGPKTSRQRRELGLVSLFAIGVVMYSPSQSYLASLHAIAEGHAGRRPPRCASSWSPRSTC